MKTTGAQWSAYMASWPDGQWFDDSDETFNGISPDEWGDKPIPPDAVVEFSYGVVFANQDDREGISLTRHFRRWLKAQSVDVLLCEVPKEKADALRQAVSALGGKVL